MSRKDLTARNSMSKDEDSCHPYRACQPSSSHKAAWVKQRGHKHAQPKQQFTDWIRTERAQLGQREKDASQQKQHIRLTAVVRLIGSVDRKCCPHIYFPLQVA